MAAVTSRLKIDAKKRCGLLYAKGNLCIVQNVRKMEYQL